MINWKDNYDSHAWGIATQQQPLTPPERTVIERLAGQILGLTPAAAQKCWGCAHPPGRHANTVLRVHPGVPHRFSEFGATLGLKFFNATKDSRWLAPAMVKFHATQRKLLPGLPNPHVQEVYAGGSLRGSDGIERHYLVQQWIEGDCLEACVRTALSEEQALQIADDLFLQIIIPLWGGGDFWWDVRASNYVVTPEHRLIMIDSDVLAAYLAEKLAQPPRYEQRNCKRHVPLQRYPALVAAVALASPGGRRRLKGKVVQAARQLFTSALQPVLAEPYPLRPHWPERATAAYQQFRARFERLLSAALS